MTSHSSKSEKWDSPNNGTRQRPRDRNPLEIRIDEALNGKSRKWLAEEAGIPESTLGNGIARGVVKSDDAIAIATALDRSLDWLLTGADRPTAKASLRIADDADWIDVSEYDLRELTDESLGLPVSVTPIRRDWLYAIVRATSDLWLTRLQSDYPPAGLAEDMLVICRTVAREALAEGHICLWRFGSNVVVGKYSVVPDASFIDTPDGPRPDPRFAAAYYDPALGIVTPNLIVPPSAIEAGRYHLVGRILGSMVRPL